MKKAMLSIILFGLLIAACGSPGSSPQTEIAQLTIKDSTMQKAYTRDMLESFDATQASFKEITYIGVPLSVLITDAGFNLDEANAVKAVATDGFSANYEIDLAARPDTLVAYAQADGTLADEELPFRMVLPDQEGKLNVRQLIEIQVVK